jgi:hypothetical protein
MRQIETLSLYRLTNGAHYAFHGETLERINADAEVKRKLGDLPMAYEQAIQKEKEALLVSQKSFLTNEIKDADTVRDETYSTLRSSVKVFMSYPDAATREAGERLWQVFKDLVIDVHAPLYQQTGITATLVDTLENGHKEDVARLNLTELVTILRAANEKVTAMLHKRNDERKNRQTGLTKIIRKELDAIYKNIVEEINALARVEKTTVYDGFIDGLDQQIKYFKQNQNAGKVQKTKTAGGKGEAGGDGKGGAGSEIPDPVAPAPGGGAAGGGGGGTPGGGKEELPDPLA